MGARWAWVPDLPAGTGMGVNRGLEAVARDAEGRVHTLAETPTRAGHGFDLLRLSSGLPWHRRVWEVAGRLTHDRGWAAVGADFGPDGAFYLLERRFVGLGFASRIRRFDLSRLGPDALPGDVLWSSAPGQFGNLEGIALWKDRLGRMRAVMVADDNGWATMRGELVEVGLPEAALASPGAEQ
jgi:hypothetical protein